jgi:hypothetical protein
MKMRSIKPSIIEIEFKAPRPETYPETYLHVYDCKGGTEWIMPIRGNGTLDLKRQIKNFCKKAFGGELTIDGDIMPKLDGDYYGKIMTDGRPPESVICWNGGGFYLKSTY